MNDQSELLRRGVECVEFCVDIIREENKSSLVKSRDGIPTPN
jgi:hypothetical protein